MTGLLEEPIKKEIIFSHALVIKRIATLVRLMRIISF